MLSTTGSGVTVSGRSRGGAKRVRGLQRTVHLLTAVVLVGFVYLTPAPGSVPALAVQWIALPVLVLSGLALWKWHRIRRLWRRG